MSQTTDDLPVAPVVSANNRMSSTTRKVFEFLLRHSMLSGSKRAVVAVSGGPDSVAVLDMVVRLLRQEGAANPDAARREAASDLVDGDSGLRAEPGFGLVLAHLNHKLRAQASDDDARFVSELAARLGLPFVLGAADVKDIASRLKIGVEEAARSARYSFLFQAARISGSDRIITGHTMNDQVETFVMRAMRGAGTAGLAGMSPVRPAHQFPGFDITIEFQGAETGHTASGATTSEVVPLLIRPALCLTREEIEQYCRDRSMEFRVDASNQEIEFTRNRIRREVIPALRGIEPQAIRSIARAMEILAIDNEDLEQAAIGVFEGARTLEKGKRWGWPAGVTLRVDVLASQPRAILRRVILRAVREVSGPNDETTSTHIAAIEALIHAGRSGKHVELARGIRVWRDRDWIVVDRRTETDRTGEIELTGGSRGVRIGGFVITLERKVPRRMLEDIVNMARLEKGRKGRDWGMAVLDDHLVPDILIIRSRRPGERASVIGQTSTNKLKKLMIGHKIPVSRRASWPLAFTLDSRYVWSPGMPPSTEFAVNRETRSLAILRAREE